MHERRRCAEHNICKAFHIFLCSPKPYKIFSATEFKALKPDVTAANMSSTLSGGSALWAFIALGWNTAFYRSGADQYPSEEPFSPVLTSPFICAAEIVIIVGYIVYGKCTDLGWTGGAQLFIQDFNLSPAEEKESEERKNWKISKLILFSITITVAALTQAIKLLACRNVSWVQHFATAAFIVLPTLRFIIQLISGETGNRTPQRNKIFQQYRTEPAYSERMRNISFVYIVGYNLHFSFWVQGFAGKYLLPWRERTFHPWDYGLLAYLVGLSVMWDVMTPHCSLDFARNINAAVLICSCGIINLSIFLECFLDIDKKNALTTLVEQTIIFYICFWAQYAALGSIVIADPAKDDTKLEWRTIPIFRWTSWSTDRKKTRKIVAWLFATCNLLYLICYYVFVYDATNTTMPAWAQWLG